MMTVGLGLDGRSFLTSLDAFLTFPDKSRVGTPFVLPDILSVSKTVIAILFYNLI